VGDLEHREVTLLVQRPDSAASKSPSARIERAEWFVEQQYLWAPRQRSRHRDELPLAPTQSADGAVSHRRHAKAIAHLGGRRWTRRAVRDVGANVEMRKQICVLIDDAESSRFGRRVREVIAAEYDPTRRRLDHAGDGLEQRRLSRAGGTNDDAISPCGTSNEMSGGERHRLRVDALQRDHVSRGAARRRATPATRRANERE
jgi:hypothetical protein